MNNIKLSYQPAIYMTVGLKNEEILGQFRG